MRSIRKLIGAVWYLKKYNKNDQITPGNKSDTVEEIIFK